MIAASAHTKVVQEQLGRTTATITIHVYGHLFPGSYTEVGKHVNNLLAQTAGTGAEKA